MKSLGKIYYNLFNKLIGLETEAYRLNVSTIAVHPGSRILKNELHFLRDWLLELREEIEKTKLTIISNIKISVINNMQAKFILNVQKNSLLSNRMNKMEQSVLMLRYRIYKLLSLAS